MFTEGTVSFREARPLLEKCSLFPVDCADYRVGIWDSQDELAATGALVGDMLQMIAVDPAYQGENLAAKVVTALVREAGRRGIGCVYMIAKRQSAAQFQALGFKPAAETAAAVLLEWGSPGIAAFCKTLEAHRTLSRTGCIVMNANPFTKGHRYLVEKVCEACERVIVLAVEEDRSEFPFDVRLALIREGLSDLPQVTVLPGSRYVISSMTFPAYFVRDAAKSLAESEMDAVLFGKYIAPSLGVTDRFVGTEPLSASTAVYNETLQRLLPQYGIELHIIDRTELDSSPVSASAVRKHIAENDREAALALVPETTADWLRENWEKAVQFCTKSSTH
ncbi:MAG: [citrate (pro-3S)-lyase] ligase [Clostridia bacterium]|nr:[citrate (pro-3S)-lyase] ligase [Clostridia bacterium]